MARLQKDMDHAKRTVGGAMGAIEKSVGTAKTALAGLASGLTAGAFAAWIRNAIDAADRLNDLKQSTGLAVESLSGLTWAAKLSGTDLEGVAKGINKLSIEMAKDAEKFAKVGITARDPIEALKQLSDVFVSIEDPQQRAAFGAAALGKQWEDLAPLLAEGGDKIGEMVKRGQELYGITQEMADEAGKFNDQLDELKASADGAAISIGGPLVTAINAAVAEFKEGIRLAGGFGEALLTFGFSSPFGTPAEQVAKYRKELEETDAAISRYKRANSDTRALEEARAKTLQQLQMAQFRQRQEIDYSASNQTNAEARRLGLIGQAPGTRKGVKGFISEEEAKKAAQEYAAAVKSAEKYIETLRIESAELGLNADQVKMMAAAREAAKAPTAALRMEIMEGALARDIATKAHEKEVAALKTEKEAAEEYANLIEKLRGDRDKMRDDVAAQEEYNERIGLTKEAVAALDAEKLNSAAASKEEAAALADLIDWTGQMGDAYRGQAEELRKLAKLKKEGAEKEVIVEEQKRIAEESQKIWDNFRENIQRNLGDELFDVMNGNFENIGDSFKRMVLRMLADAAAADITNALLGKGAGGSGGWLGSLLNAGASLFGGSSGPSSVVGGVPWTSGFDIPGFANGGDTPVGQPYWVGEKGPELRIDHTPGTIIPNHKTGEAMGSSGKTIEVTYAPTIQIDSRTDRAEVQALVTKAVQQGNAQLVDRLQRSGAIA